MSPRARRVLAILSWCLAGAAILIAAYGQFSIWGVQAPALGKSDMGIALFLAFSGAWALIVSLYLAPVAAILAIAAWLARAGSPLALLIAALASGVPLLLMN